MRFLRTRWFRLTLALGLVAAVALGAVQVAHAVEMDDDGYIGPDEVIDDDVFITANAVVVDGTVNGNLFASGNTIEINGVVNGDLVIAGSEITIGGNVDGSVASAGYSLIIEGDVTGTVYASGFSFELGPSASVGRNLLANGLSIETANGSTIGRDILVSGYQTVLGGHVERDANLGGVAVEINGSIGRDATITVAAPSENQPWKLEGPGMPEIRPSGLRVGPEATIGGQLTYTSPVEQAAAIRATPEGGVVYTPTPEKNVTVRVDPVRVLYNWIIGRLRLLITLLALGGLALWKAPAVMDRVAEQAKTRTLLSAWWGLVTGCGGCLGIGVLAVAILLLWILAAAVTLGGLGDIVSGVGFSGLGVVTALFSVSVAYVSKLIVSYMIGKVLFHLIAPQYTGRRGWPLVVGIMVYVGLSGLPLAAGWIIAATATLIGLGAMALAYRQFRSTRAAAPPVSQTPALPQAPDPAQPVGEVPAT